MNETTATPQTTVDTLIEALSAPPASFEWTAGNGRVIGTCAGFVLDIWPDKIEALAIMAPDQPTLTRNNAMLLQLVLSALRADWHTSSDWLAQQFRQATQANGSYAGPNYTRGVVFSWNKQKSHVILTLRRT